MRFLFAMLASLALFNGAAAAASPAAPDCAVPEWLLSSEGDLTHVLGEIRSGRRLTISVIGSGSSVLAGPDGARFAYPARLQQALGEKLPGHEIKVTAHVQPRQTTAEMAAALPKLLAEDKPTLVIWQAGTVDALRGIEPEDFRVRLQRGIDAVVASGADIIVMNMQYSPRTESMLGEEAYVDVMHWVAKERGVVLFDRRALMRHWTDAGIFNLYAPSKDYVMARRVHDCIGRALATQIVNAAHLDAKKKQPAR